MKRICIVIPCYNEAKRFPTEEFLSFMQKSGNEVTVFFVNDGSTDHTGFMLDSLKREFPYRIRIASLDKNVGKAEAVRQCMMIASQDTSLDYLAYLDADFATSPAELIRMYGELLLNEHALFVLGARWQHLGANIKRNTKRHYLGRVLATVVSIILRLEVYDTQCGAKIIQRSIVADFFNEPFISRWLFDVEILGRMIKRYGLEEAKNKIVELPLKEWIEKGDSKIRLVDIIRVPADLFKIFLKFYF